MAHKLYGIEQESADIVHSGLIRDRSRTLTVHTRSRVSSEDGLSAPSETTHVPISAPPQVQEHTLVQESGQYDGEIVVESVDEIGRAHV